jgi:DNA-binding transcriptional regulator GbsR (MarR family)
MNYPKEQSRRSMVLQYISEHPGCTAREVARAMDMDERTASSELAHLARVECIRKTAIPGSRFSSWEATGKDMSMGSRIDRAKQIITDKWPPVQMKPQGIFAALGL